MSCRGKVMHALSRCDCFQPRDFAALLETERPWCELLIGLAQHGANHPGGERMSTLILEERTRWLRN
jgi:hypothetical protein